MRCSLLGYAALTFLLSALPTASINVLAQTLVPNIFEDGTPASAAEVNANFEALLAELNQQSSRLETLEEGKDAPLVELNCTSDPAALTAALEERADAGPALYFGIRGECVVGGGITIARRIRIVGLEITAGLRPDDNVSFQIFVGNQGSLLLKDLLLRDAQIYAVGSGEASLNNSKHLGTAYIASLRGGSIAITNMEAPAGGATIGVYGGGQAALGDPLGVLSILAYNNSTVSCLSCGLASFDNIFLELNSTFCATATDGTAANGDIAGDNVYLGANSSMSVPNADTTALSEITVDSSSVLVARNSAAYYLCN